MYHYTELQLMRPRFEVLLLVAAALLPASLAAQRAMITGQVVVKHSDVTVGYTVIGAKPTMPERFTNADGKFVLRDVRPGRVTLSARHIGFAPFDTTLDVASGDSVHLRLELSLITIQLPAV